MESVLNRQISDNEHDSWITCPQCGHKNNNWPLPKKPGQHSNTLVCGNCNLSGKAAIYDLETEVATTPEKRKSK